MKATILGLSLYLTIAASLSAGVIGVDTTSGTTAFVSGNGGLTLGWEFEVTVTNGIVVDGLGYWDHQSDDFILSQTFPVGLWDANTGTLLRSSVITSSSALTTSAHSGGDWRVNSVTPLTLPPGLYRIGALMPVSGANQMVDYNATYAPEPGIQLVRFLRHIGGTDLTMPDLAMNSATDVNFGPTFTFNSVSSTTNPATFFHFTSSPTAWIGQGQTLTSTNSFTATRSGNLVRFSTSGYQLEIIGAGPSLPMVGFYPGGTRYPFNGAGVGLNFTAPGRGNNTLSGWFNVLQADYQTNGAIAAFAVDFVQYDETVVTRWNRGSVRYNSTVPAPGPAPAILMSKLVRTNGICQFTLAGPADTQCVIQSSSNLVNWVAFSTNTISPVGLLSLSDSNAAGAAVRFYRAVSTSGGSGGGSTNNDNFANRIQIPSAGGIVFATNATATKEPGEPNHGNATGGKSLWWTWTAPASGLVSVSLDGSSFDTTLGVYRGTAVNSLTSTGQDDESGAGSCSRVIFTATAGVTYQIAVDGYFGASGNIKLTVKPGVLNDAFADRLQLIGSYDFVVGNNVGATYESFEPYHWPNTGVQSVWWTWQASSSGTVTISTAGSNFDTIMAAYTGNSMAALSLVANNDDSGGGVTSQISFFATAGTVYQIAVDGYDVAAGSISLLLQQ